MLVEKMGLMALLPALFMEAACLFGLRKTGKAENLTVLCLSMETAVLLIAAGDVYGRVGAPAELGWAALILAMVFHAAAHLTLCGFILKRP